MALFKIAKGIFSNLPESTVEGQAYFTTDTGEFYIDTATSSQPDLTARAMLNGLAFIDGECGDHDGAWLANHPGLQLRDGLSILYRPNKSGTAEINYETTYQGIIGISKTILSYTCLNLNSQGWKKCYLNNNTLLTTQIAAGMPIMMVYNEKLDDGNGAWQIIGSGARPEELENRTIETEILNENSDNIPTSGAVVRYIKSLSYDGDYFT